MLSVWLVSCDLIPGITSGSEEGNEAISPTIVANDVGNVIGNPVDNANVNTPIPPSTDIVVPIGVTETMATLTVWLPSDLAPQDGETAVLENQINAYANTQPDIAIRIEYKTATGQGSTLNYLRSGQTVAPSILPSLIVLPAEQLATAVTEQIIFPLDGQIEPTHIAALYPAGQEIGTIDEQLVGYPFVITGLSHIIYNNTVLTSTVGTTWEQLRTPPTPQFLFSAAGADGATLALQLYLDAGGMLMNESDQIELQAEPLAQILEQLNLARNEGVLLRQSSTIINTEAAWQLYQAGTATMMPINANFFLQNRDDAPETAVSPIPGIQNSLTPLVDGWAWAISATDPTQRALASGLLDYLISAENMAEWSFQSNQIPSRQDAFSLWPSDDAYISFLQQQIESAVAHPLPLSSPVMDALTNAVFNVVTLTQTPQIAAEEAAASLQK